MNGRKSIGAVHRVVGLVVLLCLSVHCAARGPALTTSESTSLDRADALVRDGCYGCLRLASETYESLIDRPSRRLSARVLRGLFDVTLLLAVREKEIGLAADASLARARALLSGLVHVTMSERTGPLPHLKMLLEAAEAVVGDSSGLDAGERAQTEGGPQRRIARPPLSDVHEALQTLAPSDLVAGYLALALDCGVRRNLPSIGRDSSPAINDSPLMRYRVAICSSTQPTALTQLRDEDPRWMEAFFFEGKYEMGSPARSADPLRAAAFLTHAREAFPDSIAIHVMLARAQEMNGEFAGALASFDNVLALKPTHVDARLGRVRNLSYLGRSDEGIVAATTLIDSGTWHVGEALYWRAWNEYQARRLEPAWADVQDAMRLLANTSVYALAGIHRIRPARSGYGGPPFQSRVRNGFH